MTDKRLKDEMRELAKSKSDALNLISGILGINIGGQPTVEISSREGFVWVRLRGNTSELIQAYNASVSPIFGLPVLVTRSGNKYSIVGRDVEKYDNWGQSSYLPKHGTQHSFAPELGFGGDVSWIYSRQFVPLSAIPSGSAGAGSVIINSYVYRSPGDGSWKFVGDVGSPNALTLKPTGTSARILLLCLDTDTNIPLFITGTTFFSSSLTGTSSIAPYIPPMNNNHFLPISAIRLVSGTNVIGWDNIYDMRQFSVTTPVPFVGGLMVRDEGIDVGTGSIINFVGAGVNAVVLGDTITVSVTGSTVEIQDEGVSQGSVSALNFVGNNVDAMVIGSTARIFITGSTGGGGGSSIDTIGIAGQDEGVNLGTGTVLNVTGAGAILSRSGTVLNLDVSAASVNTGTLDARYLKLDSSNDPITGIVLDVNTVLRVNDHNFVTNYAPTTTTISQFGHLVELDSDIGYTMDIEQQPTGSPTVNTPILYMLRRPFVATNKPVFAETAIWIETQDYSGTTTGGLLRYDLNSTTRVDINPSEVGTGTAVLFDTENQLSHHGKLLMLSNAGTEKFWVNASGTAFERNTPLAKESGAYGTFTTVDGKTVTVRAGIITSIV